MSNEIPTTFDWPKVFDRFVEILAHTGPLSGSASEEVLCNIVRKYGMTAEESYGDLALRCIGYSDRVRLDGNFCLRAVE